MLLSKSHTTSEGRRATGENRQIHTGAKDQHWERRPLRHPYHPPSSLATKGRPLQVPEETRAPVCRAMIHSEATHTSPKAGGVGQTDGCIPRQQRSQIAQPPLTPPAPGFCQPCRKPLSRARPGFGALAATRGHAGLRSLLGLSEQSQRGSWPRRASTHLPPARRGFPSPADPRNPETPPCTPCCYPGQSPLCLPTMIYRLQHLDSNTRIFTQLEKKKKSACMCKGHI